MSEHRTPTNLLYQGPVEPDNPGSGMVCVYTNPSAKQFSKLLGDSPFQSMRGMIGGNLTVWEANAGTHRAICKALSRAGKPRPGGEIDLFETDVVLLLDETSDETDNDAVKWWLGWLVAHPILRMIYPAGFRVFIKTTQNQILGEAWS